MTECQNRSIIACLKHVSYYRKFKRNKVILMCVYQTQFRETCFIYRVYIVNKFYKIHSSTLFQERSKYVLTIYYYHYVFYIFYYALFFSTDIFLLCVIIDVCTSHLITIFYFIF